MPKSADLTSLQGIAAARETLYEEIREGKITEQKANTMERVLRGQVMLRVQLPLQFLKVLAGINTEESKTQQKRMLKGIAGFIGEYESKRKNITPGGRATDVDMRRRSLR